MIAAAAYQTYNSIDTQRTPDHTKSGFEDKLSFVINPDGTITLNQKGLTYVVHGLGMWFAWGLLGFLQLASTRYFRHKWRVAMWVHRISGALAVLITLSMGLIAFNAGNWELGSALHCYIGLFVMITSGMLGLGGFIARKSLERMTWNTKRALTIKSGHKLFGYALVTISEAAIVSGGLSLGDSGNLLAALLCWVHIGLFVLAVIGFEAYLRYSKKREDPFEAPENSITRDEFEERVSEGEQLVLLDDLVLDVSGFKSEHPGGQFLVEHHIGMDVSKFFYGGYTLEHSSKMRPVTHSNIARKIVNSLIVARLTTTKTATFSATI